MPKSCQCGERMKDGTTYYGQSVTGKEGARILGVFRVRKSATEMWMEGFTPDGWESDPTLIDDLKEPNVREIDEATAREAMGRISALRGKGREGR
jgi:hypothetical protein